MSCWREGNQAVDRRARRWESTSLQGHACWDKQEARGKSGWSVSRSDLGFWLWWEKPTSCSTMEMSCFIPHLCLSTLFWGVLSHCTASVKVWELCTNRANSAVSRSVSVPLTQIIFVTIILREPTGLQPHWDPQSMHPLLGHPDLATAAPYVCLCPALSLGFWTGLPWRYPYAAGSFSAAPSPLLALCVSTTNTDLCNVSHVQLIPHQFFFLIVGKAEVHLYHLPHISAKTGWIPQERSKISSCFPFLYQLRQHLAISITRVWKACSPLQYLQ